MLICRRYVFGCYFSRFPFHLFNLLEFCVPFLELINWISFSECTKLFSRSGIMDAGANIFFIPNNSSSNNSSSNNYHFSIRNLIFLQGFRLLDVKINEICRCVFYLIESSSCPECNGSKVDDNG